MEANARSTLPAEAAAIVAAYLQLADRHLPGRITGLYLTGSIALDDYRPGQSDVDFVSIADSPLTPLELSRLRQVHHQIARQVRRPRLDGVYVTWPELQAAPAGSTAPYWLDGRFRPAGGFAANPVTWFTLHRYPLSVRGPARPAVWHDDDHLRAWCRNNLETYWVGWVHAARSRLKARIFALSRRAIVWGVLGVTRLHATISSGDVISKSAAGTYALDTFPSRWSPIVEDALGGRLGRSAALYRNPFTRRTDALAFMEYVIADATPT